MKEIAEFITNKLSRHKIKIDVSPVLDRLVVSNKVNEFMTPSSVYTTFLLHLGKEDAMYKAVLNGAYLFDMEVEIKDAGHLYEESRLKDVIMDVYNERIEYVYVSTTDDVHFVGIKLSNKAYKPVVNYSGTEDTIPYFLLVNGLKNDFKVRHFAWNELLLGFQVGENEHSKYVEILEHIKGIRLPVSVIDDDSMHMDTAASNMHVCYLHCGSHENWPEDQSALDCAKTALYCLIYKKSRYKCDVGYDHVLLKYKGSYFKFLILIKRDRKTEFRINSRISEIIGQQPDIFKKNVISIKKFLDKHGYFPVYFDDRLIELICLMCGRNIASFGKFFNEFLEYKIRLEGCSFSLETFKITENKNRRFEVTYKHDLLCVGVPPEKVIQRLNALKKIIRTQRPALFNDDFKLQTYRLQRPSLEDYDFVLSSYYKPGFVEIEGQAPASFLLGKPVPEVLSHNHKNKAYLFYSPGNSMLMVKMKNKADPEVLLYVLALKTGFKYYLKNF